MGLTARFDKKTPIPNRLTEAFRRKVENDLVQIFRYVGEQFVRDARLMTKAEGGFGDDTGNLRSSIGYFILKDGSVIDENLRGRSGFGATNKGKAAAINTLSEVEYKDGYTLVGVAGMDYARDVESRGYNVITFQKEVALINLQRMLFKYVDRLNAIGFNLKSTGELVKTDMI